MDRYHIPKLVGIGLLAGLAGTIAMTLSQKAEMKVTQREPSDTPARAVEKAAGVTVADDQAKGELSTATHFAYGTAIGLGLAALDELPVAARLPLFLAGAWGVGQAIEVGLGVAEPPMQQEPQAIAIDLGHHLVYAAVAAGAYALLKQAASRLEDR